MDVLNFLILFILIVENGYAAFLFEDAIGK